MPSIKDVAKLAGVSISTVSRVINKGVDVDTHTRQGVLEAIKKLDYRPNLVAKALRGKSGYLIGLLVPETMGHSFTAFINYTMEYAYTKGYNVILGNTHNNPDIEEKFIDDLISRKVNGIIFSRVSDESSVLHKIGKTKVPIAIIDRALAMEGIPVVVLDNYKAGALAAEHLTGLNHEKLLCVTGPLNINLCRERLKGFRETMERKGIRLSGDYVYEGDFKFEGGVKAARFILQNKIDVTAIWAQNDMMAFGVLKELCKNGVKIPENISLMGMDDLTFGNMLTPALTTIHQPFKEMCEKAVELIIMQNEQPLARTDPVVLPPSLIVRETTGSRQ